ncbi:nucleotidyltransferase family protein [Pseudomonas sp.]|uniref:nucleotidyltransferase family protein n=1 Tax=Pseudomonas sp. TaxID=306 RepID=UPI0026067BBF|nr:nucleotidyltransferase family protein [Pseudomonas sp.]
MTLLIDLLQQSPALMQRLTVLSELNPNAYLAAGVIRNLVWSSLHAQQYQMAGTEIDVIFYDAEDVQDAAQVRLSQQLSQHFPENTWDVVNQALVHQWYRTDQGERIAPLSSIEHALSLWPETATAIAVRLLKSETLGDDQLEIIAPFGLTDLLALKVRWNPALVSHRTFMARVESKGFLQRWPQLTLV